MAAMRRASVPWALLLSLLPAAALDVGSVKHGSPFPDFSLPASDGSTYKLDYLIHDDHSTAAKVLLWWFPQANTPGCTMEGKRFKELHDYFVHAKVQIVGASADTQEENKAFSEEHNFNYPLLCDMEQTIPKALGLSGGRWAVLINKDKKIEKFWPEVSPGGFPDEALAFVQRSEL
uniref:thioredoxin-dependent peroxiredoxin n=1 Tax=Pyrodinium bahamense TaxID=73915 RepID=A0A7S0FFZ9_9DINO